MTNQTTIRQGENTVEITGVLAENRLEYYTSQSKKNFIRGQFDIKTGEDEIHTVRVFSSELKKDGTPSAGYKGFETVMNEYKSIQDVGEEEATKVMVRSGTLEMNDYKGGDGMIRSFPQISTFSVTRPKNGANLEPKAELTIEGYIQSISAETDREGEETGRIKLKLVVALYGGAVAPFEFIAPAGDIAEHIDENWEVGQTVTVYADIINRVETKVIKQEVSFGKPKERTVTNSTREYVITGGSDPYEEDDQKAYSAEVIKKALAEREVMLDGLKDEKKDDKKKEAPKKSGFGKAVAKKEEPAKDVDVDEDDLPF
ncbi:hypothetical protein [Priestia megaterium]|uniref:hypothetical protein n=1 Tax=Priestia megaterium TaxID=1404 RepID=UPI00112D1BDF|nr:hypothetical protein [Priestia megaterium]TPF18067.1 hypothetical protein CBE78_02230 [Priestia megaterium]TPF22174.1 hypothetical protein CBE79_04735 [Priestia megaterium]